MAEAVFTAAGVVVFTVAAGAFIVAVAFTAVVARFAAGTAFTAAEIPEAFATAEISAISTAAVSTALTGAALVASAATGFLADTAIRATDLISVSASVSLPIGVGVTRIGTDILHIGEAPILTVTHTVRTSTTILTTRKTIPTATAIRVIVASGATLVRAIKATVAIIATRTLAIQIVMTSRVPQDRQMGWRPMALLGAIM